ECRDCGPGTTIIEDRGEGFNVCLKCGVVCGSQIIDETAEHRVFADDAQTGRGDPSR
ncbi:transcription initiation factor IIB, partial [Hyaloraphidium curvatum]